jgi:hypothetical protein
LLNVGSYGVFEKKHYMECTTSEGAIMVSFKGAHFGQDMILTGVRWYVAYPLSYHQVEELMQERGVSVDHVPINRGVLT